MLKSVFYVSVKAVRWPRDGAAVEAITEVARSRNAGLDITGALISTDEHFAQLIEGPPAAVDTVMASIFRDPRHWQVTVLEESDQSARLFPRWPLAYANRSSVVALRLTPRLVTPPARAEDVSQLMRLIRAFAGSV